MTAGVTIMAMTTTMPAAPAMVIETALAAEREMLSALATAYQAAMSRIQ